ncbi:MAG: hypothetical protein ACJASG_002357 [Oleiphilaceae bacterium]|jgi:hypothetical protein
MKNIQGIGILLFLLASVNAWAEEVNTQTIQVIVSSQSELTTLNRKQVMGLFLGRSRSFPNGINAKAFDHEVDSTIRARFFESLTGKSISDIDAYWARLRYSGRASPPKVIDNMAEILKEVSQNLHAIAYIQGQDPAELMQQDIVVVHTIDAN